MAVYGRNYQRYEGPLITRRQRFLVVPRYAMAKVLESRAFLIFFLLCFVVPFSGLLVIYLRHNLAALKVLGLPLERIRQAVPINAAFFNNGLQFQAFLSFLVAVAVAPALVAPDLRNNGLALYLARPVSRWQYMLGKLSVLAVLLSAVTWLPGLVLFALQAYLEGSGWVAEQQRVPLALVVGSLAWIVALSLLALAVSAWVKWRPVARIVLLIIFFVLGAFGTIFEHVLGTWWGHMLSIRHVSETIWAGLFGLDAPSSLPVPAAWFALIAGSLICLALLLRRIRAYEVVR
jgi:ABC-2 type transport system permease protein